MKIKLWLLFVIAISIGLILSLVSIFVLKDTSKKPPIKKVNTYNRGKDNPKIAIIIDDLGERDPRKELVFEIDFPVTVAVLPQRKYSRETSDYASSRGFQVLLHQPMESVREDQNDNEPGMIFSLMSQMEIRDEVYRNLETVPDAVGMNNHKGSKATADKKIMEWVLNECRKRGMFFVDSRTTSKSIVSQIAQRDKVPYAVNVIFLDSIRDKNTVRKKLSQLIEKAKAKGQAIGIGHATYKPTIEVLKEEMPKYLDKGIDFVYVMDVINN